MDQSTARLLHPTPATAADHPSQADEALRRALAAPKPQPQPAPQQNLLARALADATDTVTGRTAGHLTYTADNGDTVTVTVDVFLERQIARAVHNASMESRALAALEAGMVANSVRTVASAGRRSLSLVRAEAAR